MRQRRLTDYEIKRIVKLLQDGLSGAEIARTFGVDVKTIYRIRKKVREGQL